MSVGVLVCSGNKLITGSNAKKLRLWSIASVKNLTNPKNKNSSALHDGYANIKGENSHSCLNVKLNCRVSCRNAQVHLEQELLLDGTVISAVFDDVMDMGIVGTTAGTLWYINWADSSSIRLISGHKTKVNLKNFSFDMQLQAVSHHRMYVCVQVNGVVCSPDERHVVTCGQDGSVRVWALQSHELLVQFQVLNQVSCTNVTQLSNLFRKISESCFVL